MAIKINIKQALQHAGRELVRLNYPAHDAAILLADILGKDVEYLFTYPERRLTRKQIQAFNVYLLKRSRGYSVAVIIGYKHFFGKKFKVSKDTLIPRPETELMTELALKRLKSMNNATVLDLGTGSGNIIVSLASEANDSGHEYYGSDISSAALKVARHNAKQHKTKVKFIKSNLFSDIPRNKFDLITANLPYLTTKQMSEPSIYHEPAEALWGGPGGLELYKIMLDQVQPFVSNKALLLMEIDPKQKQGLKDLLRQPHINLGIIDTIQDLAGHDRILAARRN